MRVIIDPSLYDIKITQNNRLNIETVIGSLGFNNLEKLFFFS